MKLPWKAIAKIVGASAPLLGSVLGGPLGGAAGTILASVLGVEADPGAVAGALDKQTDAAVLLRKVELKYQADLVRLKAEADVAIVKEVNQTMRSELTQGEWYQRAWRPLWGFVSAICWTLFMLAIIWKVMQGDVQVLTALVSLISSMTVMFSIAGGIVGVTAFGRSQEKVAVTQGRRAPPTNPVKSLIDRMRGRKPDSDDDHGRRRGHPNGNWSNAPRVGDGR